MRMMIRWTVPADEGNEAIRKGTLQESIQKLTQMLNPEAAYYFASDGKRAGLMVFDMKDSSQIPPIAEQLFQAYEANVEFLPVMNADDLQKAFSQI